MADTLGASSIVVGTGWLLGDKEQMKRYSSVPSDVLGERWV